MFDGESRPWGHFDVILSEEFYKVKRLVVAPGQRTSMQRHSKRAEHWTVVNGSGHAWSYDPGGDTVGKEIGMSDAIAITTGSWHRVGNDSEDEDLVIIEVQLGFCEEGDIERREDDYGRLDK